MKSEFLKPRYWGIWLLLGFVRLAIKLPYAAQLGIGRGLGYILRVASPRRWRITLVNLERCLPELDTDARIRLAKAHFDSLGIAFLEFGMCWWGSEKRLRQLGQIEGLEHLQTARAKGNGVILLCAHFTTLEITGRLLGLHTDLHLMYRPNENPLIENIMRASRERLFERAIPREDVRLLLKSLRSGKPVWYATDQGYRGKHSEMVPFFGIPAPTNVAISRLARTSSAPVVPFFAMRLPGTQGYRLVIEPELENFPGDDPVADTLRLNQRLEQRIRLAPEQYLWSHDRFKIVPRD
ncbi:MAG TPA: LpxL/LpxP family Kdo(2)-lipid IV(A) lauroyl/palmitoleoyl acyltransferase [Gammaproteobacteria bacterium]|nr:LpxL/LpxP family Kdo(2)-lipid IV(A) lauroyl/palmitoleoyl acyltransferase [Gammaproteobacteria bacterium]